MKIMSWNIGSMVPIKWRIMDFFGCRAKHEYFQSENGRTVSCVLQNVEPDVVVLQEIWDPSDVLAIEFLDRYPYRVFCNTWYRDQSVCIASKHPIQVILADAVFRVEGVHILPIHFDSFSAKKRVSDVTSLLHRLSGIDRAVILGDTNLWSWFSYCISQTDRISYMRLTSRLIDATKDAATGFLGASLDKIFVTKNLQVIEGRSFSFGSWTDSSRFMDHRPVVTRIKSD